jgi:hypothetical protein
VLQLSQSESVVRQLQQKIKHDAASIVKLEDLLKNVRIGTTPCLRLFCCLFRSRRLRNRRQASENWLNERQIRLQLQTDMQSQARVLRCQCCR